MRLALRDLDTGLFFNKGYWVTDSDIAQHFPDRSTVEQIVLEYEIKNAEMVFLEEEAFRLIGGTPIPYSPGRTVT